jgi:hypothetical protein
VGPTRRAITHAAEERARRYVHAFPNIDHAPSNAICRKAGFVLFGAVDFEYPSGSFMRCNDWQFDLVTLYGDSISAALHAKPGRRPVLLRPGKEVHTVLERDRVVLCPVHDPGPARVVSCT